MVQDINAAGGKQSFLLQRIQELAGTSQQQRKQHRQAGADQVTLNSGQATQVTYDASLGVKEVSQQVDRLREMVLNTLREQGVATSIGTGDTEVDMEQLSVEEAQSLISKDGYFGVEQTSERIFQFAAGMIQAFPEHKDAVLEGFLGGFAEAEAAFGGALPEISYQTRDAFQVKMDEFLKQFA